MAVCRHCGAIIDDGLDICPDCGQPNTDVMDESYLDSLLNSLVGSEPVAPRPEKKKTEEPLFEDISEVEDVFQFSEALDFEEIPDHVATPAPELTQEPETDEMSAEDSFTSDFSDEGEAEELSEDFYNLMDADEDLESHAYNIFDEFNDNDVDALIAKELQEEAEDTSSVDDFFQSIAEEEPVEESFDGIDFFGMDDLLSSEEPQPAEEESFVGEDFFALSEDALETFETLEETQDESSGLGEVDFAGLDDLFQGFSEDEIEEMTMGEDLSDHGLEELLAAEIKDEAAAPAKKKNDERSIWQRLFGNVPIDPSKKKPEPTPEELEAKRLKKEEAKKKSAEEKKIADAEKKEEAKRKKEEKARQAQLAKEEKQKRKMEAAKQVLEELEDTRINRVGSTIVFAFFGLIALILIVGSNLFTYSISMKNAEKNFNMALNNDVKYYNEAYNHIYGLEMRNLEDEELEDKILTVMFVNKELNSYNSYMGMKDYESALHSLIKGLYRYGVYIEHALEISIDDDMDFVRTQILRELEATFDVSEDESEILRNMLYLSLNNDEKAKEYSVEIYKIVNEAENLQ